MATSLLRSSPQVLVTSHRVVGLNGPKLLALRRKRPCSNRQATGPESSNQPDERNQFYETVRRTVSNNWYQGGIFVSILGLIDAAYSGDWSRIGVLSKETEATLQSIVLIVGGFHAIMAIVAARILQQRGKGTVLPTLKVFFVGTLAFLEVVLSNETTDPNA